MARGGMWAVWFGKSIAVAVLTPLAVFFTYKANCDSVVFNVDAYRNLLMKILGMRVKRSISRKDVIIEDPDYRKDADEARWLAAEAKEYSMAHKLKTPPNFINVFFKYQQDHAVEEIGERMETMISDLSNSRDRMVINLINEYPVIMVKAHTRPFERKWMNIVAAVIVPVGLFFYFRMWRFRLRLMHDLVQIEDVSGKLANRLDEINKN